MIQLPNPDSTRSFFLSSLSFTRRPRRSSSPVSQPFLLLILIGAGLAGTHAAQPTAPVWPIQDRSSTVFPLPGGADTTVTRPRSRAGRPVGAGNDSLRARTGGTAGNSGRSEDIRHVPDHRTGSADMTSLSSVNLLLIWRLVRGRILTGEL